MVIKNSKEWAAYLLGAGSILYIGIAGPIKVVDVLVLISIFLVILNGVKLNLVFYTLLVYLISIYASYFFYDLTSSHSLAALPIADYVSGFNAVFALITCWVVSTFSLKATVSLVFGFMCSFFLVSIFSIIGLVPGFGFGFEPYLSSYSASIIGTLPDPSRYGFAAALFSIVAFFLIVIRYRPLLMTVLFFTSLAFVFLNGQRASMVLTFIGCSLLLFLPLLRFLSELRLGRFGKSSAFTFLALNIVVGFLTLFFSSSSFLSESRIFVKISQSGISYSDDPRSAKLQDGVSALPDFAILGAGPGAFSRLTNSGTSHNTYLETALSSGMIGLLIFISLLFFGIVSVCRRLLRINVESDFFHIEFLKLVVLIVFSISAFIMNFNYFLFAFVVLGSCFSKPKVYS